MLRQSVEQLVDYEHDVVNLVRPDLLYDFYRSRGWQHAWSEENRQALRALLDEAPTHGLRTEDYFVARIDAFAPIDGLSGADRARADLTLSAALLKYGYHVFVGKVQPETLDSNWNVNRELEADVIERIEATITSNDLRGEFYRRFRVMPVYLALQKVLARYRGYQSAGGFVVVPEGPTLRVGDAGARVAVLRQRLSEEGWETNSSADTFGESLEAAVKAFQTSRAANADGIVGARTIAELNVPVTDRIQQIRASLERLRWVRDQRPGRALVVNIAGFRVYLLEEDDVLFSARAQVGKPYRQTPVFKSSLKYLVMNPTWTVPPGILRKDVLPAIRKDPNYLANKHMDILTQSGERVDPATIDWQQPFRYIVRQRPGPWNSLGTIKFIFPNSHFVFVHDTPSRTLFEREDRTFSSGCIRVENPWDLAELTLAKSEWDQPALQSVLESGDTKTVFLDQEMPVYLLYLTALAFDDGEQFYFFRDVYSRDEKLLAALDRASTL